MAAQLLPRMLVAAASPSQRCSWEVVGVPRQRQLALLLHQRCHHSWAVLLLLALAHRRYCCCCLQ